MAIVYVSRDGSRPDRGVYANAASPATPSEAVDEESARGAGLPQPARLRRSTAAPGRPGRQPAVPPRRLRTATRSGRWSSARSPSDLPNAPA